MVLSFLIALVRQLPMLFLKLFLLVSNLLNQGEDVYEGMVVGEHTSPNDLILNVVREKHLTSVRTAGKDENIALPPVVPRTLGVGA
jgi:GTP-binding protein